MNIVLALTFCKYAVRADDVPNNICIAFPVSQEKTQGNTPSPPAIARAYVQIHDIKVPFYTAAFLYLCHVKPPIAFHAQSD
jgi:hypothetical protein